MPASHAINAVARIRSASERIRTDGAGRWLFEAWRRRVILPAMRWPHCPMRASTEIERFVAGRHGLEIGGPSPFFRAGHQLPLYDHVAGLDNCNFADETIWEGEIREGAFFVDGRKLGRQFVCEAADVANALAGRTYDFVLSSNCLEHVANPLAVLEAWLAVLDPRGMIVVVVPNQRSNFDHRRPVTGFKHLLADYRAGVGEDDTTHFDEVLALTDLHLTTRAHVPDAAAFRRTVLANVTNRCVHHHVFDAALLLEIAKHLGLEDADVSDVTTDFVLVGRKPA